MNINFLTIEYLMENGGICKIEDLCPILTMSVDAVKNELGKLIERGVKIEITADNKLKYLNYDNDLNLDDFDSYLSNLDVKKVEIVDSIGSTNAYIKEHYEELDDFYLLVARTQTGGRGRMDRSFFSYDGGLYFSFYFDVDKFPNIEFSNDATFITAASAIAVLKAVQKVTGVKLGIKWVNDLLYNNLKCAGILAEAISVGSKIKGYCLGVGINVFDTLFPDGLKNIATNFLHKKCSRTYLLAAIIEEFINILKVFNKDKIVKEYKKHLYIKRKKITITNLYTADVITAKAVSVNSKLELICSRKGRRFTVNDGEVKIRVGENK